MLTRMCSVICLLLLGGWHGAAAQTEIPGIREFLKAWDTAWNAHNVEAIVRLHADDCVTVNRFGTLLVGKAATRKQMQMLHGDPEVFKNAHFPPCACSRRDCCRPTSPLCRQRGKIHPCSHRRLCKPMT